MPLQEQISQVITQIRNNPIDHNLRLQLIQQYCIAGQWEQAFKALQQYLKLNPKDQQTQALFLGNIECELARLKVFRGETKVTAYSEDNEKASLQCNLLKQVNDKEHSDEEKALTEKFIELHEQVNQSLTFTLNDQTNVNGEVIDTDVRLSHVFEIFEENRYSWLSVDEIESVEFKSTEILTDLIWRRTEIVLKDQRRIACFVPVRYPFESHQQLDDALLYARTTSWENKGDFSIAYGQKTYTNAELDLGILDISSIRGR